MIIDHYNFQSTLMGPVTSPNRFNFAIQNRNVFIKKNQNNIFEDFTFCFYKYLGKKAKNKKQFENKFEKPLIKYFSPEVNNVCDKGLKFIMHHIMKS